MIKNKRYIFRDGKLVEEAEADKPEHHYVMDDLRGYQSPVTLKMVEGRTQRREDLIRSGCREVDPSERNYQPERVYKEIEFGREDLGSI